jgi:hypothetical protein
VPTLFARALTRVERWILSIDVERDRLARSLTWESISEVERAFICERLRVLDVERAQAVALLGRLELEQFQPALMFTERPVPQHRMLKVPLYRKRQERKRA